MIGGAREYPLTLALDNPSTNAPPEDVVLKLLTAFPAAASTPNANGDLPLHLAVRARMPLPILERILADFVAAMRHRNVAGDLPLHAAVKQDPEQYRCEFEVIEWLVKRYPEAASSVDGEQELPLHVAARTGALPATINLLLQQCPAAWREVHMHGDWPLHSAVRTCASFDMCQLLLEAEPAAARVLCRRTGQLPLHVGIASGAPIEVLTMLVEGFPGAVRQRDTVGDLPLRLAMQFGPLELVERLLLAYPESVQVPDRDGVPPVSLSFTPRSHTHQH
jgi:ankyrin repeat protein